MQPDATRETQVREVLIEAIEVQLAALKAAMAFWGEWIERTSVFVTTATNGLDAARFGDKNGDQILLEMVDAGRESVRSLTELPRNAAAQFVRDLDEIVSKRQARKQRVPRQQSAATGSSRRKSKPGAKRRVRAKP